MPTETLTERKAPPPAPAAPAPVQDGDAGETALTHAQRVRRLKINVVAWAVGTIVLTTLWVLNQWQANGAFEHFGSHEGNPGDWNPTLWALAVGLWGLVVGIMALRVHFERPVTDGDRGAERAQRLKFHAAAWALGMAVLTPLWALIEWQDNGGLERWSGNSNPGDWEPWILYVGGIWALVVILFALKDSVVARRAASKERAR
jgi:hypothetical protein